MALTALWAPQVTICPMGLALLSASAMATVLATVLDTATLARDMHRNPSWNLKSSFLTSMTSPADLQLQTPLTLCPPLQDQTSTATAVPPSSTYPPPYISDSQSQGHLQGRTAPDPLRLDVLSMTSQRHDGILASPSGAQARIGHMSRGRSNETDLTHGLGHLRSPSGNMDNYEERHTGPRDASEEMVVAVESPGPGPLQHPHRNSGSEDIARDRRSPSKPDYPYKKSAL
ncbi:BTB/POZ domain-containing protein 7 [Channa argus]|uniref:BTB/POZ domain-containing protein 7 n=1 Tax=Channa argus TaxID=215402 RepID=A0A6G1QF91_CHAAH|nr:BTB/POZ domain-containing protein 7 [Channa argus]